MKKWMLLLFAVALTVLSACSKGEKVCCAPPKQQNYMEAKINDTVWVASAETNYYNDSLYIWGNRGEEHLSLVIKYHGIGSYPLKARDGWYFITVGHDIISENYFTQNTTGTVNITGFDRYKQTIEGNFNLRMVKSTSGKPGSDPIKLSVQQGKFRVALPK